ncbi:septin-2-like isoform X2 [Strongylocentrotus purpuratus]|uniref:Septin n=1 Tax=Strongylocentrotus purpuratus TaxID=7668 RepID=A0A7M7P9E4_STRPU|nr:septin-2-like isoform X2 [Strongylocentrotus purpuratus]
MTTYNRSQSQPGYRSSWVVSRPIRESSLAASQRHSAGTLGERFEAGRDRHGNPGQSGREYVGFATLPEQMQRKSVKRGFEFTLMVVGETGLGKSTLVNSLFLTDLYKDRVTLNAEERIDKTAEIQRSSIDIEEQGVRLRLTVVDTPGFGDSVNSENSWGPIISHIESKFEQYYRDESGLNRKNLIDDRVHCCLYFISPYGHGLRPIDIEFMKRLHDKVNIVPIIAKADCLTKTEVKRMKDRVLREISEHEIGIYAFPDCESDEDEDFKKQDQELKASIPFAVIGSNTVVEVNGRRVRGRLYPWGITEVENPKHCDFVKLRNMLIRTHMQDLKDVTRDVHYENYRLGRIRGGGTQLHRERSKLKRDSGVFDEVAEKDRMLEQKEVELRQMQVMLEKMQREMAVTQRNSRGDNLQYDDRRSSTVEV